MNREDVIRMAREVADKDKVDPVHGDPPFIVLTPDEMIRFAALVATAEREACARVCDEKEEEYIVLNTRLTTGLTAYLNGCRECAAAIRARG